MDASAGVKIEKLGAAGRKTVGEKFAGAANGRHAIHHHCAILISPSPARRRLLWTANKICTVFELEAFPLTFFSISHTTVAASFISSSQQSPITA
jgi:hypothetical protein